MPGHQSLCFLSLSFLLLPPHHTLPASDLLEPTYHLTMSIPISDPLETQAQINSFFPELLSAVAFTAVTEKQLMANKGNYVMRPHPLLCFTMSSVVNGTSQLNLTLVHSSLKQSENQETKVQSLNNWPTVYDSSGAGEVT